MTRETKIGLLVGLAFIITVGILLSNYMADRTELAQAPLEFAARTGHNAVVPPGESTNPIVKKVIVPDTFVPGPVPTRTELDNQRPASDIRVTGPAQTEQTPPGPVVDNHQPAPQPPSNNPGLIDTARQHGEEVVGVGGPTNPLHPLDPVRPNPPTIKSYVAQPGDNLSKIALKAMGASTKANRDAIVKANPKLAANPNLIVAGQSYVIPTAAAPAVDRPASPTGVAILPIAPPRPTDRTPPTDRPERTPTANLYIVKDGDNSLWGIAIRQCGTPQAVASIKELNKEVLKGGDLIRVGMRLKMPTKAVAVAD